MGREIEELSPQQLTVQGHWWLSVFLSVHTRIAVSNTYCIEHSTRRHTAKLDIWAEHGGGGVQRGGGGVGLVEGTHPGRPLGDPSL
jgi:hypothetical protein